MKRKLRITLLGLLTVVAVTLIVAVVVVHSGSFRGWLETRLATALTEATGRRVTLQIRDLAPLRLQALVEDFTIDGASPESPPLTSVARIDLDANWSAVFRRRADLSSLTIDGLRVDLEQLPPEWLNPDPESPPLSLEDIINQVAIDRLEVTDGWLHFARADLPLDLLAEDVSLTADYHRLAGRHEASLRIGAGGLSIPEVGEFPIDLRADFSIGPKTLALTSLELQSAGLSLSGSGELTDLALPGYQATFEATVTPGALPLLVLADLKFDGAVAVNGTVEGQGDEIHAVASVSSERFDVASVPARDIAFLLALEEGQLRVIDLSVEILGTRINGELSAAAASGLVPYAADLHLASDDPDPLFQWLFPESRPGCTGSLTGSLGLSGTAYDLESLTGTLAFQAEDLVLPDAPQFIMAIDAAAECANGVADIRQFTLSAPGTRVTGSGVLAVDSPSSIVFNADVTRLEPLASGIDAAAEWMDGSAALPDPASRLRGHLVVDGELGVPSLSKFDIDMLSGRLNLVAHGVVLAEAPDLMLDADMETRIAGGELNLHRAHIEAAGMALDATGGLGTTGATVLSLRVEAPHLDQSLAAARDVWGVLNQPGEILDHLSSLSGSLLLNAEIDGDWAGLDGTADVAMDGLVFGDQPLGRLTAEALSRGGVVKLGGMLDGGGGGGVAMTGALAEGGGEIVFSGELDLGGADGIPSQFTVRLHDLPLEPLVTAAGLDLAVSGAVDGDVMVTFPGPEVRASLALLDGAVAGVPLDVLTCELLMAAGRLEVTHALVETAGGTLSVSGVLGAGEQPDGSLSITGALGAGEQPGGSLSITGASGAGNQYGGLAFEGSGFQLGTVIEHLDAPVEMAAILDVSGTVTGDLDDPRLKAVLKLAGISLFDHASPALEGELSLDPNGFDAQLASSDGQAMVKVGLGFEEGAPWTGEIRYPLYFDTRHWQETELASAGVTVDGVLRTTFAMASGDLATLEGLVRVEGLHIDSAGCPFTVAGPLDVRVTNGSAVIEPFRLEGGRTRLDIGGSMALAESLETSLSVRGPVDLQLLRGFDDQLRIAGLAEIDLSASGPVDTLDLEGTFQLRDGRLRHPDLPVALENIEADVTLQPERWQLSRLEMNAGGGTVTGDGEVELDGLQAETFRFQLTGRRVRMAYPEGFRSELDADLELVRESGGAGRLSGELRIIGGLYDEDFRIEEQFLARTRAADRIATVEPGLIDQLDLDLRVTADDGLWVRNNLASMETSITLQIGGTIGIPAVSGRVRALEGGTVTFRGVDYSIVRGSIDFPGGPSAEPALDIRAETAQSDYDILLAITGTLENLKFDLSSTPPLSQTDIVTLLVTGRTRDELGSGGGGLSDDEATIYLSGRLTDSLAPALKRSLGLDEVTVNPVLMGSQADPTARITVGKALTSRLFVTYSSLMGSDRQDIYQAKYRLTDRLNLLGTRDEDGSLAGDLMYRARLYRGPPRGGGEADDDIKGERKIETIEFRGNSFASARKLRRQLGVAIRDHYHRSRLLGGLERIRDWYYSEGFPEIEVEHQVIEEQDTVDLIITVAEGRRVLIRLPGAPRPRRPLRREMYRLWSRSIFREGLLEEGTRLIVDALRDKGYVRASVEPSRRELEPGEEEVVFRVDRGTRIKVDEIRFSGIREVQEKEIRSRMLTRKAGLLGLEGFSPDRLDEDVEAIRNYYATVGFLDAVVSGQAEYLPDDKRVVVSVDIEEGARYRLGPVTFGGNEAFTGEALIAETGLRTGSPFNDAAVREAERKLVTFYDRQGYSGAGIRSELRIDRDGAVVDVAFQVEESAKLVVEEVEIVSRGITNPGVIRRELELWAGQPLSTRKAGRSQYNLYRTGLFRSVGYEILPGETPEGRRVVFTVEESPNLHFDYGIGYNSDFGVRVSGNVAHTNVLGRGLYVGLGGRYSGDDSRAQFVLRKPRLWNTEFEGLVRAFWEEEDRVNFDATRLGGVIQGTRRYLDDRYTLIWGYGLEDLTIPERGLASPPAATINEWIDPLIDPRVETEVRLGSLRFDAARDTRDAFLWPSDGSYTRGELSIYDSALLSEAEYLRGFVQWNRYQKVFGSSIWISGVRLGLAEPYGGTEAQPISERYFTGGESSIRGFKYDSLPAVGAPLVPGMESGMSTGGNALFLFNQELAIPLADPLYMLLFYDAGNLYWQVSDFDITDLRHSAGLGIRIKTPVGPLRLEYGWKLDRQEDESSGRFHFSFGMPF